ncbi:MAG TPA: hypothetical protein VMU19_07005 [Bryobacteraceae bacterium]|nr:hypothetical protein [Bryobacteraceae bacterium]
MTPPVPQPESAATPPAPSNGAAASTVAAAAANPGPPPKPGAWRRKFWAVLFATVCLEIGCYLAVFPWTAGVADFAAYHARWRNYLDPWYIKVAVSALGGFNLYIAAIEILRLRRGPGR